VQNKAKEVKGYDEDMNEDADEEGEEQSGKRRAESQDGVDES
jgi:hypothetical protein